MPETPHSPPGTLVATPGGPSWWTPPSVEHLQSLLPQYEVIAMIGYGGMGAVYQARQIKLDRMVAVKILPPDAAARDELFMSRFINEARTMARLNHPAIVSVYDFGETVEGQPYFVMEYVSGTDVAQMILSQSKLSQEEALAISANICSALEYAHAHGVIHRDIKPANVLINDQGQVKVTDFGLARMDDPSLRMGETHVNMTMGTPDFVAPEALTIGKEVDSRADLYAVGVMLYNMVTGEIPRGVFRLPSEKVGTDIRLDTVICKAMENDPHLRYQTAVEMHHDIHRIISRPLSKVVRERSGPNHYPPGDPADIQQSSVSSSSPEKGGTAKALVIAGIAALVIAALVGGIALLRSGPVSPSVPVADKTLALEKPDATSVISKAGSVVPSSSGTAPSASAAVKAPKPVVTEPLKPKQTLDLLALVDLEKDRVTPGANGRDNHWVRNGKELHYQSDGKAGKVASPVAIPAQSYSIEVAFEHVNGGKPGFLMDLPADDGYAVSLLIQYPSHQMVGDLDGPVWPENKGEAGRVLVRVERGSGTAPDHIHITFAGETIMDWKGRMAEFQRRTHRYTEFPEARYTSLQCLADSYKFSEWTLRVFEGEAKLLR